MAMNAPKRSVPESGLSESDRAIRKIRAPLLRWYDANRRDLPWRHSRDPFAIWISEAMLQQTRVDTVIPYWNVFWSAFPMLRASPPRTSMTSMVFGPASDITHELET